MRRLTPRFEHHLPYEPENVIEQIRVPANLPRRLGDASLLGRMQ
jgi:hypothetical protein